MEVQAAVQVVSGRYPAEDRRSCLHHPPCKAAAMAADESHRSPREDPASYRHHLRCKARAVVPARAVVWETRFPAAEKVLCLRLQRCRARAQGEVREYAVGAVAPCRLVEQMLFPLPRQFPEGATAPEMEPAAQAIAWDRSRVAEVP